jgi:conjugative transfer pilus assembly protein TraH
MRNCSLLLYLLFFIVSPAKAGLDDELKGVFDDMINVTPGGSYDTQRRGVITGGSIVSRNKMVNPNLVSFVPPGVKAGCGGIDLYGGSFSYINSAQLTQLMRSIAQAAMGYAFQLAIEGMCPTCAQVIAKLQKDITFINSLMKNSCEAGKLIVDNTLRPGLESVNETFKSNLSTKLSTDTGFVSDWFQAKEDKSSSPDKKAIDAGRPDLFTGNVVYKSLNNANATSWFQHGDDQLKGVLMSLTGTYIAAKKSDNSGIEFNFRPSIIEPKDFVEGGMLTIYKCESDDCLLPGDSRETIQVTGMRARVRKMILGTGTCGACTGGILRKMQERSGGTTFTNEEKQFIEATSPGAYGLLTKLAHEPGAAHVIAEQLTNVLTIELTNKIIDEMYDTVRNSVESSGKEMDTKMLATMRDRKEKINEGRRIAGQTIAGISTVLETYSRIDTDLRNNAFHKTQ